MSVDALSTKVVGHVLIKEHEYDTVDGNVVLKDDGKVVVDEHNAVHPQNMARVFARALANEPNYFIHRVAFGNGGTEIDVASNILFNPPRDGLNPGDNHWEARLYNETYSEIVDDSNINVGSGPGALPSGDPSTIEHVSGPGVRSAEDLTVGATVSSVIVNIVLNPGEPSGQVSTQQAGGETNTEADFMFDELGLFTAGAPPSNSTGYQDVDVGGKEAKFDTGLDPATVYQFNISVDGGNPQLITVSTPSVGTGDGVNAPLNAITYADLVTVLNVTGADLDTAGAFATITDDLPTQEGGAETYGYLRFESKTSGSQSAIAVQDINLFTAISGFIGILPGNPGVNSGIRNDPINPDQERERMLTHLVFSPVLKSADRVLSLTYTLNIVVARTT